MILYEDRDIIVCHKPAGIPVQSARIGQIDMVSILCNHLVGDMPEIHVVHRLDQPVEGVIVFTKTKKAAASLGKQMTDGSIKKIYRAVCCAPETSEKEEKNFEQYHLADYLVKDGRTNTSSVSDKGSRGAKRAELSFQILDQIRISSDNTLLLTEIELKTGRHHQIRVQMSHAGLPLFGDQKYNKEWKKYTSDVEAILEEIQSEVSSDTEHAKKNKNQGLALCAASLTFFHPVTGKPMKFQVKPQGDIFRIFQDRFVGNIF